MKKHIYKIALIGAIIINSCSSDEQKSVQNQDQPIKVKTNKVSTNRQNNTFTTSGKLVAKNNVNLSTRVMGYITKMNAQVGQNVRDGQVLVSINNTDIEAKEGQVNAQIAQAQVNYNLAKKDYIRFLNLYQSESVSQKELDDMKTRYEMAKTGLQASQQMKKEVNSQYRYTQITAPISGTITAKYAEQGDLANPGMPLLTIESSGSLQAQVLVSEQYITQISKGMPVDIILKSNNQTTSGNVSEISQSSTHTGGQYLVKINIPNAENFRSGMFINAQFPIKPKDNELSQNSIIMPKSALVEKGQLVGIYTISQENTAVLRWVKLGKNFDNQVEILSGLSPDETYIIDAEGKLYNGAKITLK